MTSNEIEIFLNFLLDTETTSDIVFNEKLIEKKDFYQEKYRLNFEIIINQKFQLWNQFSQREQTVIESSDDDNDECEEDSSSDENEQKLKVKKKQQPLEHIVRSTKKLDTYIDSFGQCKRLLQLLYHCHKTYPHFSELYFRTLEQCTRNSDEKLSAIGFEQIVQHLYDDNQHNQRLKKLLPTNIYSSNIPQSHRSILLTIQTLLSSKQDSIPIPSPDDLDILYPSSARFLDVRREFRDSTHYFIDGDSLILSVVNHVNIDLLSYNGNTLHSIFIIERILLTLYNQAYQYNYTIVFFDCHYQCYQNEISILSLIRSCLIHHLRKNKTQVPVREFSSWINNDYSQFINEEKPHFIFYHDLSSFHTKSNHLLSENSLNKLLYIYRLFGNYHQFYFQCHLYLMNKLILTDTILQCFEVHFKTQCSQSLIKKFILQLPHSSKKNFDQLIKIDEQDVRLSIYLRTITEQFKTNQKFFELVSSLLILHVVLLIRLSLIDRHLPMNIPSIKFTLDFQQFISQFQKHLAYYQSADYSSNLSWSKIADLFDGRLFTFTIYQLSQSSSKIFFDHDTLELVNQCLILLKLPAIENSFHEIIQQLIQSKPSKLDSNLSTSRQKITKISNPFIDTLLQPIPINQIELINPENRSLVRYEGRHHWHVYQEVGDELSRIRDNDTEDKKHFSQRFRTRTNQKFYTYFDLYGKSLTSRDVRDNHFQIVLPKRSVSVDRNLNSNKKSKQKKNIQPKKADLIKLENEKRKLDNLSEEEKGRRKNIENQFERIAKDDYENAIDFIDKSLVDFKTVPNRLFLFEQKFRLQRKYLGKLRKKSLLTNEEQSKLDYLLVGYFATMTELVQLENIKNENLFESKKKFMEELINQSPLDLELWYKFQLEKINSRLPRREQGVKDDRVQDFIPDQWQVEFLNAVDKEKSIIIVAPTASGKTYASYYAMKKILEDRDSIGVYIAPSKALVNQVAATIYSKFGPIVGIFTRDYRINMQSCRILVTVPQCMQILLLSPNHQKWCQRIKYAIFDEIHCMSGEQGSDVWEKTMLLINCPMIGLSATVNNGEDLGKWIEYIECERARLFHRTKPRQVSLIVHHERMADLNKYLYVEKQLHPLHPIGMMDSKQLINRGIPNDFSLSPYETLQLKNALSNIIPNNPIPKLKDYFLPEWIIERNVCNQYSNIVRRQFDELIETKNQNTIDQVTIQLKTNVSYPESKPIRTLIREFILTLKEQNLLPCIVFSDSRSLCEQMAASIFEYLKQTELVCRETKYKKKIDELKTRLEILERTKLKKERKSTSKRTDNSNLDELEMLEEEENTERTLSGFEQQLLSGILDEGTLANRAGYDQKIVDSLLERASYDNPRIVEYMKRGVAYHHAGLNNKSRVAVEALFRNRYVQVVFSTSTLALGIHMPTKTVAFVKDSIYLDALQYRQSSGRAGRRGFDVQGHVVFVDIPLSKIRHLIISAIPNIHAHFPTSITFFMRLLHLYSNAKDSTDAMNRSLIALQCPLLGQIPEKRILVDIQTRFHSLFTLDFLYRLNLVDGKGNLTGLVGLSTHLHYFEPANIIVVYLMDTHLFHTLKDPIDIVTVLAYLFTNSPWLITRQKCEKITEKRRIEKLNSKLFLPSISNECRQRIDKYNSIVKDVYGCYIETITRYLRSIDSTKNEILPFSDVSFARNTSEYDNGSFEYNLHHHQAQQEQNPSISPFAGPSGLTHDTFMSNYNPTIGSWDLVYNLDLTTQIVPYVDIDFRDHTNTAYYLNSYALDFFKHGSQTMLIMENELNEGDIYNLLLDFRLMLSSIKTSLETILLNSNNNNDLSMTRTLYNSISNVANKFSHHFIKQYPNRNRI